MLSHNAVILKFMSLALFVNLLVHVNHLIVSHKFYEITLGCIPKVQVHKFSSLCETWVYLRIFLYNGSTCYFFGLSNLINLGLTVWDYLNNLSVLVNQKIFGTS